MCWLLSILMDECALVRVCVDAVMRALNVWAHGSLARALAEATGGRWVGELVGLLVSLFLLLVS